MFFTGYIKQDGESKFKNINTGEVMEWPDLEEGHAGQNYCSLYHTENIHSEYCLREYCSVCRIQRNMEYILRGVCPYSDADNLYVMQQDGSLLGYIQSKMIWSSEDGRWEIKKMIMKEILAYTNDTVDHPIGTHPWYFTDGNCRDPGEKWRKLNFHQAVQQPGLFCCDDGLCIASELRCDNIQQCKDNSDEKNWDLIRFPTYEL